VDFLLLCALLAGAAACLRASASRGESNVASITGTMASDRQNCFKILPLNNDLKLELKLSANRNPQDCQMENYEHHL
jgi:hypothetical protein